jgi:hypothetical protein
MKQHIYDILLVLNLMSWGPAFMWMLIPELTAREYWLMGIISIGTGLMAGIGLWISKKNMEGHAERIQMETEAALRLALAIVSGRIKASSLYRDQLETLGFSRMVSQDVPLDDSDIKAMAESIITEAIMYGVQQEPKEGTMLRD